MKNNIIFLLFLLLGFTKVNSQDPGDINPFANAIQYSPTASSGYSLGTFTCGATFTARFGIGQTTNAYPMPPVDLQPLNSSNALTVDITITNLSFNGSVTIGGSASAVISGSYSGFFTWTYLATNIIRGVQSSIIPPADPFGGGAGLVNVALAVPNQSNCTSCMIINVKANIPSYIIQLSSQIGDDGEQTNASFNCRSLPIQLFQLNSLSKKTAGLNVEWKTQNESNTDYFEVYRMYHGNQSAWMKVGKVEAAGVSHDEITYNFLDNSYAKAEKIYYRIKQVDQNGSFTYTDIKSIDLKENGLVKLSGFPNPIQNIYHLAFNSPSDASIQIEVIDLLGKVAFKQKASAVKGYNQYDLEMKDVAAGTYFVKVSGKEIYQALTVV
jgi:hypothetical protein